MSNNGKDVKPVSKVDVETRAIRKVMRILDSLDPLASKRVVDYVTTTMQERLMILQEAIQARQQRQRLPNETIAQ